MAAVDSKKAFEDFQAHCRSLPDYDDIEEYLKSDDSPFEPVLDARPFVPDFSRAIIVDNIPSVDPEKIERLKTVLLQIYNQFGETLQAEDIEMPVDPNTRKTCGYCFIRYKSTETAEKAVLTTQDFRLDGRHVFKVNLYSDMYKYVNVPETYQELEVPPFEPRPDTIEWLTDEQCRDMFVIRHEHETEVMWSNAGSDPELVYGGEREKSSGRTWCESYVTWSPQGTYLATFHPQGVRLWGGADFKPCSRFAHPNAEMIDFSPCENYVVTYRLDTNSPGDPNEAIIIWDVRSGEKKKVFKLKSPLDFKFQVQTTVSEKKAPNKSSAAAMANAAGAVPAPKSVEKLVRGIVTAYDADRRTITVQEGNTNYDNIPVDKVQPLMDPNRLKWSPDGQYAAKVGVDIIQVFAVPSMSLLDKKSIAAKDMLEFVWSPKRNMISYWAPGSGNHPAQIHIIEIPSRRDVCSRKVFDIQDGRMIWQSEGEYLCVSMTKQAGKKKSYILMLFRAAEENVPVEQIELNEPVIHFSWEQGGSKFAVIHGEARNPTLSFYTMRGSSKGGVQAVTFLFSITGKQYGEVIWSPSGGVAALAQFASDACMFDLHDVENNVALASRRHDRGNRLVWDPSGRYIASCTIIPLRGSGLAARAIADDGFNIYTFQGSLISQVKKERLYQFSWRPRPKDLLSPEEKIRVNKNLKKYEKIFDKEDRKKRHELDRAILDTRMEQATEFYRLLASKKASVARAKARRIELRDGYDSDDDSNYKVVVQVKYIFTILCRSTNPSILFTHSCKRLLSVRRRM